VSVRAQGPVRVGVRFPFRTHPCGLVPASDFNWLVAASVGLVGDVRRHARRPAARPVHRGPAAQPVPGRHAAHQDRVDDPIPRGAIGGLKVAGWVTTAPCRSEAAMALSRVESRVRQNPMHGSTGGLEMEQPRPRQPLTLMRPSSPPRSSGLVSSGGRAADGRHWHRGIVAPCRWFSPGRCVSAREAAVPATSSLSARLASGVRG
jgi:hypothetical protein